MGSVLRSFGAFQGNIWSVAPFIPVGPGENQCCPHKTRIFSKSPNGPIFKFFLVVQNIVFDIIHSKIRPNNFFPYIRILTSCEALLYTFVINVTEMQTKLDWICKLPNTS